MFYVQKMSETEYPTMSSQISSSYNPVNGGHTTHGGGVGLEQELEVGPGVIQLLLIKLVYLGGKMGQKYQL